MRVFCCFASVIDCKFGYILCTRLVVGWSSAARVDASSRVNLYRNVHIQGMRREAGVRLSGLDPGSFVRSVGVVYLAH